MHILFLSEEFSHSLGTTETNRCALQRSGFRVLRSSNDGLLETAREMAQATPTHLLQWYGLPLT